MDPRTRSAHRLTFTGSVTSTASKLWGSGWVKRKSKIAAPLRPHPATVCPFAMHHSASARPRPRVTPVMTMFIAA